MPGTPWHRWVRPVWLLSALLALAVVAAACGDDDDEGVAADAEAGVPASTAAAQAPAQAPPPTLAAPAALKSFRYDMTMELSGSAASGGSGLPSGVSLDLKIAMSGTVIPPDREQSKLTADFGFLKLDMETIRIGDRVWTRQSGGEWQEEAAGLGELGLDFSISPVDLLGADETGGGFETLRFVLGGLGGVNERVNGVDAVRYDLTSEQFTQAFPSGGLPSGLSEGAPEGTLEDMKVQLWIARDSGIPVRMVIEATAGEGADGGTMRLDLNLSDLNSSEIEIEPPA